MITLRRYIPRHDLTRPFSEWSGITLSGRAKALIYRLEQLRRQGSGLRVVIDNDSPDIDRLLLRYYEWVITHFHPGLPGAVLLPTRHDLRPVARRFPATRVVSLPRVNHLRGTNIWRALLLGADRALDTFNRSVSYLLPVIPSAPTGVLIISGHVRRRARNLQRHAFNSFWLETSLPSIDVATLAPVDLSPVIITVERFDHAPSPSAKAPHESPVSAPPVIIPPPRRWTPLPAFLPAAAAAPATQPAA